MAERTTQTQVVQLGVETVAGTAVPANKRLSMTTIDPRIQIGMQGGKPQGSKYQTWKALTRQWSTADIGGGLSYREAAYLFDSLFHKTTPVTASSITTRTWTPSPTAIDDIQTFTVQRGSSVRAEQLAYGALTGLTINADRGGDVTIDGELVGRKMTRGATLTATPTLIAPMPVVADEWAIYLDTTSGAIGTTRLTRVRRVQAVVTGRQNPQWFLDNSVASWAVLTEGEPTATFTIRIEADATGDTLLDAMEAEATRFVRFEAVGPTLAAGNYRLRFDMAGKVKEVGPHEDDAGLFMYDVIFDMVEDSGWGKAYTVELLNDVTAL